MTMRTSRKIYVSGAVLALFAIVGLVAVLRGARAPTATDAPARAVPIATGSGLATAVVAEREVEDTWIAEGVVEAVRQASVAAQIAGRIVALNVEAGEGVRRGQVIVRIDEREVAQAVASNAAQIERVEADLGIARSNLDRTRRLVEQKFMSQAALDKAQADFDAARAQLGVARAGSGQAVTARSYATITAPFDGVIAERHVAAGDMAQAGRPLVTLFDPRELRVIVNVPQARIVAVRAAATGYVEFPSLAATIRAKALQVLPSADSRTHTQTVRLDLAAAPAGVTPGMFARAHFPIGRARKLVIPARAIVRRSEVTGVYVVVDGAVQFRQIRLGTPAGSDGFEVLAGVQPGERVALDPPRALVALRAGRL